MKLTDNTVRISELAGQVNGFAENKAYVEAYKALDEIVLMVCHLHRQLNDLNRQDKQGASVSEVAYGMNIANHVFHSKNALDHGLHKLNVEEYDTAITFLATAYSNVRACLEHAWHLKRKAALDAQPPGENAG